MPSSTRRRFALLASCSAVALAAGVLTPMAAVAADAARPELLGLTHYTGELHSHTGLTYTELGGNLPTDVWSYIQANSDLDFYAATEKAGQLDISNADEYVDDIADAESDEWRDLFAETDAWNANPNNEVVAVPGQEISWGNLTDGHINLFNAEWLYDAQYLGTAWTDQKVGQTENDLLAFYARLKQDPDAIAQFNHPSPTGYGTFQDWHHLDPQLDAQIEMFEYKQNDAEYLQTWHNALDAGWHVAPTWSGDEHGKSFDDSPARTGIWATEQSLAGLYDAMHRRSLYASFDVDATLAMTANGQMMGSLLPASTTTANVEVQISDASDTNAGGTITIYGNGGAVLATQTYTARDSVVPFTLQVADGDWFYAQIKQADGGLLVGSPIWVGETVRGADYAPVVDAGALERSVQSGELVQLPQVTATDDSGASPTISMEVWNQKGAVTVENGAFRIEGFDDYTVIIKAYDQNGNAGSQLIRYVVNQDGADPEQVFRFMDIANVGAVPGEAAISAVTDQAIQQAWVQVRVAGGTWQSAVTVESTGLRAFDVEVNGRPASGASWDDSVTGMVLRNHEFQLTGLVPGQQYEYRLALDPAEGWTGTRGTFVAAGLAEAPIYVLGDLQVENSSAAEYAVFPETLEMLQTEAPGGDLLVQTGDLVNFGGYYHQWKETFDLALDDIGMEYAAVSGNHETQRDQETNDALGLERNAIFSGMFATPDNGAIGETNYSFDHGNVHVAVLNSMHDLDEQLTWLTDDMRASDKPWKVVVGHFSYYGGHHAGDTKVVEDRAEVAPVLQQLGIDLYIGGHDHTYKRSTIFDGRLATTPEEELLGTTYVTLGSTGPKFYDNEVFPWDDVVFDEDTQVGMALQETADGLKFEVHSIDGALVDEYLITQPEAYWGVTSTDIRDGQLIGVGVTSYPGARTDPITVSALVYDYTQQTQIEMRSQSVTLKMNNGEQFVKFDIPIDVDPRTTIKVFTWNTLGDGEPLKPPILVQEGVLGSGSAEDPYQLRNEHDLAKIQNDLSAHYLLMNDIVWDDPDRVQIASKIDSPFTGTLDGGGHSISGLVMSSTGALGLIGFNAGTIINLGVIDVNLPGDARSSGILAHTNLTTGVIERVHTSGTFVGRARVGGIVGDQMGVIRDSYSTATVTAQTRAGGIAGSTMAGSVTENTWFGGAVQATSMNAGGITGWAENGSSVRDSVVIAGSIRGTNGQAIAGNVDSVGLLANNHRSRTVTISGPQRAGAENAGTMKGAVVEAAALALPGFYATQLGWDLTSVWTFDVASGRPILIAKEG